MSPKWALFECETRKNFFVLQTKNSSSICSLSDLLGFVIYTLSSFCSPKLSTYIQQRYQTVRLTFCSAVKLLEWRWLSVRHPVTVAAPSCLCLFNLLPRWSWQQSLQLEWACTWNSELSPKKSAQNPFLHATKMACILIYWLQIKFLSSKQGNFNYGWSPLCFNLYLLWSCSVSLGTIFTMKCIVMQSLLSCSVPIYCA